MNMIKREFEAIRSNRILIATLIVVSFLPFLYSIFFLRSVWDPYGHTGNLPVAVVNEDRQASFKGKTISAGHDLVDKLKDNHKLKWEFVDKKAANEGIRDKKYFAIITIPRDFSKNATTLLDKNPKKMNLEYESNQSLNYIGNVITEQGAKQLNDKVKQSVTEAYAKAMFDQVKQAGQGFTKAADGSKQLADGSSQLNIGLTKYTAGVDKVGSGVDQLKAGVGPLASGVNQLASGSSQLVNGLGQLQANVGPLASGVNQLAGGSGQLVNGLGQLQANVGPLASGVNQLAGGAGQLNAGLGQLSAKTQALPGQANQLNAGANQIANGISQLNDQNKGIPAALAGSDQLQTGLNQLKAVVMLQQGNSGDTTKPTLTDGIKGLKDGVDKLQEGLKGVAVTDAQKAAIADLQNQVTAISSLPASIQAAAKAVGIPDEKTQALMAALTPQFTQTIATIDKDMAQVKPLLGSLDQLSALSNGVNKLDAGINQLGVGQAQFLQGTLVGINKLTSGADKLNNGLSQAASGLNMLAPGANQLAAGTNQLSSQVPGLVGGIGQLSSGANTLNNGLGQLNSKVPTLAGGVNQLANGANQLNGGLGQLNSKVPALAGGVNQLANGANQLNGGLGQLNAKVPTLANGVNQLASGTDQLTANSGQLMTGAGKLNDGATKLNTALTAGAKQINAVHFTNKTAEMFATPAQVKTTDYSYVPNYGHALAPYVLSLALYVGALVFNFVYPIRRRNEMGGSTTGWFLSKVTIGGIIAVVMAVIQLGLMYVGGIRAIHPIETLLILIVFAWASMYIVMFLAMLFDNPGRFLAMVLLMIQLGAAGGTFPMPVTSAFYNAVHWFIPMTYSVLGLRESLTGGLGQSQIGQTIGALFVFIVIALVLLWLGMNHMHKKIMTDNWAEKLASEDKATQEA